MNMIKKTLLIAFCAVLGIVAFGFLYGFVTGFEQAFMAAAAK